MFNIKKKRKTVNETMLRIQLKCHTVNVKVQFTRRGFRYLKENDKLQWEGQSLDLCFNPTETATCHINWVRLFCFLIIRCQHILTLNSKWLKLSCFLNDFEYRQETSVAEQLMFSTVKPNAHGCLMPFIFHPSDFSQSYCHVQTCQCGVTALSGVIMGKVWIKRSHVLPMLMLLWNSVWVIMSYWCIILLHVYRHTHNIY